MFVDFGKKKCPLCGRIGKRFKNSSTFICHHCEVIFDEFICLPLDYVEERVELN